MLQQSVRGTFGREQARGLLLAMAAAAIVGCGGAAAGPEAEIRAWLDEAEAHAEDGALGKLAEFVDPAYTDARGNDQEMLVRQLRLYGLGGGQRELVVDVDAIEVHGDSAAEVAVSLLYASLPGDRLRLDAGRYAVTLELVRSGQGAWTVISSRWGRAGEALR
ncbi:MAG: hypothetical protein AAFX58_01835 [Pseudomonadota bacterium]